MSIGLERFVHGIPFDAPMFTPPAPAPAEPPDSPAAVSCSSSIGRNSDCSAGGVDDDADGEVQSSYKGPLDTMDALEDSLPIKRGVSKFYCGKSKSFTSLEDVVSSCSSVKDLAKPEDPYTRKRKKLTAFSATWDRARPRDGSQGTQGGISKRLANSSRNNLCRTASTSSSGSNDHSSEEEHEAQRHLPPLHPRSKPPDATATLGFVSHEKLSFPMRSFSMTDLQGVARRIN